MPLKLLNKKEKAKKNPHILLSQEAKIYSILKGGEGIPNIFWKGREGDYYFLVIELLGPSL